MFSLLGRDWEEVLVERGGGQTLNMIDPGQIKAWIFPGQS